MSWSFLWEICYSYRDYCVIEATTAKEATATIDVTTAMEAISDIDCPCCDDA